MTADLLLIGGGVVLLGIAAHGGGFRARDTWVPRLSRTNRSLSALMGMLLLLIAIFLKGGVTPFPIGDETYKFCRGEEKGGCGPGFEHHFVCQHNPENIANQLCDGPATLKLLSDESRGACGYSAYLATCVD